MVNILLASISFSSYDWIPYPVGMLISYCKKDPNIHKRYVFQDPEYRSNALDDPQFHKNLIKADMIGLTNWVWNQNYNDQIAQKYKEYRPDGIVIYGGTNVPEDQQIGTEYAAQRPFVDIFFCGPSEEFFRKFLVNFSQKGFTDVEGAFTHSSYHVVKDKKQYSSIELVSPYLDGTFENLIRNAKQPLSAIFETNRGCPYQCAFCDWGGMTRSRIVKASTQIVKETISYIMKQEQIERIEIADANFGMFKDDVEYMRHLVKCKSTRKKEIYLSMGGFAKNGNAYVEEIMQMMHDHFDAHHGRKYVKLSFQSHDPITLAASNRSNIKNEKLYPMIKRFQEKGVEVDAEMIMGLPGDNQQRWLQTIQKNMDLKINHQKSFILYVVANTAMATKEYKEKYKIKTKKVLIPYDLYNLKSKAYHDSRFGSPVVSKCEFKNPNEYQSFEYIYECFSFDSNELMKIYDIWFWFNTLYNAKVARTWMLKSSDSAADQYKKFIDNINSGQMPFFKKLFDEYRHAVWNTIAKPEPITIVNDLFRVNFLIKFSFRGNEIVDIFENKNIAKNELSRIYPDIDFDHFRSLQDFKDVLRLYYVGAEVV